MNTFCVTLKVSMTDEQLMTYAQWEAETNRVDEVPEHLGRYIAEIVSSNSTVVGENTTEVEMIRVTKLSGLKAWVRNKVATAPWW